MEENRKKILYLITKANWGGAQKYVFDLTSELKDYEIVVVYGQPFGELSQQLKALNLRRIEIPDLSRKIKLLNEFKVVKTLWKILRKEKPDIVHLNSSKIGLLGSLVCRITRIKKIIFTAHGWAFNEDRPWLSKVILKFLSWITLLLTHHTVAINQKEYNQVINWPLITKNKLQLIYNGIKPFPFLGKEEARGFFENKLKNNSKFSLKPDELIIGTIAELHKNKGLKYALKGIKTLIESEEKLKFIIIGEGEERENLEKKIKKYNLENKVFLMGKIEKASQYLKAFDIFLLSSVKEGLPFVLLEAGLAGLPVIATAVGGVPEIINHDQSGILIEKKSENEIAKNLKELISRKEIRERLGENLAKTIKEKFSFEEMLKKTKGIYQFE